MPECYYANVGFTGVCPVSDCPANIDGITSHCIFLHLERVNITKYDLSKLLKVSINTVNKKYSLGREEVKDMAILSLELANYNDTSKPYKLEGTFFANSKLDVSFDMLIKIAEIEKVYKILKKRMSKKQFDELTSNLERKTDGTYRNGNTEQKIKSTRKIKTKPYRAETYKRRGSS